MTTPWKANEFKIAINMAGAVSAGAYTAGVLDFLMEALEEWETAKTAFRSYLANPPPASTFQSPVPIHDVSIEAFSGASAGGMCAAIASVMVQSKFDHITNPKSENTNNTFYEAWVNNIDIGDLLGTDDLQNDKTLISLLDSTVIDTIAKTALTPGPPLPRSYISKTLTLFLTLTNVRGVQYRLYDDPSPDLDEFITYYADRLRFEIAQPGGATSCQTAKPLPLGQPKSFAWDLLQDAAKATGAFPLFLAPRTLNRDLVDYTDPMWIPICGPNPSPPIISDLPPPPSTPAPPTLDTLNVDGGVTDNDPFDLAHDFLASHNPKKIMDGPQPTNPRGPLDANCAVISIAPFPSAERFDAKYDCKKEQGILLMLARLVTVLISQSRFLGESLAVAVTGPVFSRFVIAPSDNHKTSGSPLQGARLGAFGGFMERSFRAHDFLLGRRNCQMFLKTYFRLPTGNSIIAAGLADLDNYAATIYARFTGPPPPGFKGPPQENVWMPVIPLVGSAANEVPDPERGTITTDTLTQIANAAIKRVAAVKGPLLDGAPVAWLPKVFISILCTWPFRIPFRRRIVDLLTEALAPDVKSRP